MADEKSTTETAPRTAETPAYASVPGQDGVPEIASVEELDRLRVSPAAHLADLMAGAEVTGERGAAVREHPFATQIGLRAVPGSEGAAALEGVLGFPLPTAVGEVTGDPQGLHVLWLSPDEFLAVDVSEHQRPGAGAPFAAALAPGVAGQAVDLSANRTILVLTGPSARAVLEKGCHLDLHPRAFPVGRAEVTQLGIVPLYLHRSGEEEWRLYPRQSFADFCVRWLVDAMAEFGAADPEAESRELAVRG